MRGPAARDPGKAPASGATISRLRAVLGIDPRSLALFRVLLGSLLIADLALRARDLPAFYTDAGTLTRAHWGALAHRWHWSLHAAGGELWFQVALFALAGLAALALVVGWRTRAASVVSFVLLASLINRNPLVLQGGDVLLVVMAFWAMFLPLGMRLSFDAALDPALRDDPNAPRAASEPYAPYLSVASAAIVLQTLYLYFFTALLKTGEPWRVSFDAARNALGLRHFATPLGQWLSDFPALLRAATGYVLTVEFVAPALVLAALAWPLSRGFARAFAVTRLTGLALLCSLHAGFLLLLHIGLFPLIDFLSLSILVPGLLWAWLAGRRAIGAGGALAPDVSRATPGRELTLHYDVDCGFCLKMCTILREFLLAGDTRIEPAQDRPEIFRIMERENSWVVTDARGTPHVHWHAMALLLRQRAALRPLGRLMARRPFIDAGNALYRAVATNRGAMGTWTARLLPWRRLRARPTWAGGAIAGFFLVVVTAYNVHELPGVEARTPAWVERPARIARIDQRWDMFAPFPLTYSLYPLVPGTLRSGETVDVYDLTSSEDGWSEPVGFYGLYPNYRWRKYLGRVHGHRSNTVRRAYGEYLCRSWNVPGRPREDQLATVEVWFVRLDTAFDADEAPEPRRRKVWRHWCYPEFAPGAG